MELFNIIDFNVFAQTAGDPGPIPLHCLEFWFGNILRVLFGLAGFALVLMLIVGGFRILFSAGDPKSVEAGRNTLTWAFTGFALVIIAWFFLLLLGAITGRNLTQFIIPIPTFTWTCTGLPV